MKTNTDIQREQDESQRFQAEVVCPRGARQGWTPEECRGANLSETAAPFSDSPEKIKKKL